MRHEEGTVLPGVIIAVLPAARRLLPDPYPFSLSLSFQFCQFTVTNPVPLAGTV